APSPLGQMPSLVEADPDGDVNITLYIDPKLLGGFVESVVEAQATMTVLQAAESVPIRPSTPEEDKELADMLDAEVPVTLSHPAFSSVMTEAIGATGRFEDIWTVLADPEAAAYRDMSEEELRGIALDFGGHTGPDDTREELVAAVKAIFIRANPAYDFGQRLKRLGFLDFADLHEAGVFEGEENPWMRWCRDRLPFITGLPPENLAKLYTLLDGDRG
ncbi:MAG: hypothetical protein KKA05_10575, partial [Alphaproteobacteria bacterium]|nr:hypothetical protein [Alphaproteobacteria bacterium]